MKIKINELVIENVNEELSTSSQFVITKTLEEAKVIYETLKPQSIFELKYLSDNDDVMGVYTDKKLVKLEYEDGIATFILGDADALSRQVEQNTADIEYIQIMQGL